MRRGCVLLVEDNSMDVELMREALETVGRELELHHVSDGEAALAFLQRDAGYEDAPRPHLVLLDINLPRLDGHALMDAIAGDESLRELPVVVLTTSASPKDIREMYQRRCSGYLIKPTDFGEFEAMLERLFGYWFDTVTLPTSR